MHIEPIKTRVLHPPQDNLLAALDDALTRLEDDSVVVISSKVVAIWQGRCVPMPTDETERLALKDELVRREADAYLERDGAYPYSRMFSIYEGVLGSNAGIDESNSDGYLTLLPKDTHAAAASLHSYLTGRFRIANIGVIVADSRTMPMRNGAVGVSLAHYGFEAVYDYRGSQDIFGRVLRFERVNIADSIAAAAVLVMGEGSETTPLAVCHDVPHVSFNAADASDPFLTASVPMEEDVFAQFFMPQPWKRNS